MHGSTNAGACSDRRRRDGASVAAAVYTFTPSAVYTASELARDSARRRRRRRCRRRLRRQRRRRERRRGRGGLHGTAGYGARGGE